MTPNRARRVVWVVLDGLTHWVVERLAAEGKLPDLSRLAESGAFGPSAPEGPNCETPAQLATLFTGEPPRVHGILGFQLPRLEDPFERVLGFAPSRLRADPVWRRALRAGRTAAFSHVAFTDPRGEEGDHEGCVFLADGYRQKDGRTFVAPHAVKREFLDAVGPFRGNGDVSAYLKGDLGDRFHDGGDGEAERRYMESLRASSDCFTRAGAWVLDEFPADLTILYYPCTDEIEHAVMRHVEAGDPTAWDMLRQVYGWADGFVGDVRRRLGDEDGLVVCSDHGVGGVHTRVHVNRLLADAGFLAFDGEHRIEPATARVFLPPANHGYLQLGPAAREGDAREVKTLLAALLTPDGQHPVFEDLMEPGEAFEPETGSLFLVAAPGYEVTHADADDVFTPSRMQGHHQSGAHRETMQGVFLALGPGIAPATSLEMRNRDVAAVVGAMLDL